MGLWGVYLNNKIWELLNNLSFKDFIRVDRLYKLISYLILLTVILIYLFQSFEIVTKYKYYVVDEVHYVSASKLILKNFLPNINWSWRYPPFERYVEENYLNLEHPPLGKYFIILCLLLLGDDPVSWRLPSIVFGLFIIFLVYLIGKSLGGYILSTVATLLFLTEPMLNSMSRVAMLDITLTFFITLSVYFLLVKRNLFLSSMASGLAVSTKYNGIISLGIIIIYTIFSGYRSDLNENEQYLDIFRKKLMHILYSCIIVILVYLVLNIPYIIHFGVEYWINVQLWSFSVHTQFKSSHPYSSPPISYEPPFLNWLFNYKAFALTTDMSAGINVGLSILLIVSSIWFLLECRLSSVYCKLDLSILYLWFWLGYMFYIVLYFIGRSMQFIYYMTPLMPAVLLIDGLLIYRIIEFSLG